MPRIRTSLAISSIILAALTAVWTWWALEDGAYLGLVFYPGTIVVLSGLVLLLLAAPWRARLTWPVAVAIGALLLLAARTLSSILWTPAEDVALADTFRVALYAAAFLIGLWTCLLLGRRMALSMLPLAVAGALTGLVTAISLWVADRPAPLVKLGILERPLGYHNANAAFFLLAALAGLGIAADRARDWRLRGLLVGASTLCIELAILSQSRGSAIAILAGVGALVALSPGRLRTLAFLAIAVVPAALATPVLLDVYAAASDDGDVLGAVHRAAAAIVITTAAAGIAGCAAARWEARLTLSPRTALAVGRGLAACLAIAVVAGAAAFLATQDRPADWLNSRVSEFREGGTANLERSRFALNAASNRYDYWRVALDDAREDLFLGQGAGAFQYTYLTKGRSDETPHDAHSVELELLSELGVPGLALFGAFVVAVAVGGLRSRRLGPGAASLCAASLGVGAYWLTHASIEWFWTFPGVTAPVFAVLGAACAPAVLWPDAGWGERSRWALIAVIAVASLVMTQLYVSERYAAVAARDWRDDPDQAYRQLETAQDLNPFDEWPLLIEGEIARRQGDATRAAEAFRGAIERDPDNWVGHYFLGLSLIDTDPEAAAVELSTAEELNPRSGAVRRAQERLPGA